MKKLKTIIFASIIIILILLIFILSFRKIENYNKKNDFSASPGDTGSFLFNQFKDISRMDYKMINKAITAYLNIINKEGSLYVLKNRDGKREVLRDEKERNNIVLNVLSSKYVEKNKINEENLENYVSFFSEQLLFVPIEMKVVNLGIVKTYVAQGNLINFNYEDKGEITLIVYVDYDNQTFSIVNTSELYDNINLVESIDKIKKNEYNQLKNQSINMENIVKDYIIIFKRLVLSKPEVAYNYLDKDYREARFENVENFKKYIKNNYEELKRIGLEEYLVNNFDDYTEYVAKDKYGRIYNFKEKKILDYTVELDDYTILSEKFKQMYNDSKEDIKVKINIDKWIKMLNNRDYRNAYKVLNKTFRENKFGNEDRFEEVMRKALPLHYKAMYGELSDENGTYIQKIVLEDIEGKSDKEIKLSIIMELKDNYEFEMSFSVE